MTLNYTSKSNKFITVCCCSAVTVVIGWWKSQIKFIEKFPSFPGLVTVTVSFRFRFRFIWPRSSWHCILCPCFVFQCIRDGVSRRL